MAGSGPHDAASARAYAFAELISLACLLVDRPAPGNRPGFRSPANRLALASARAMRICLSRPWIWASFSKWAVCSPICSSRAGPPLRSDRASPRVPIP